MIREAIITDIPGMQVVRNAVKENPLPDPSLISDADYEPFLFGHGKGWVFLTEGHIAGFAIVDLAEHNIWALFVSPGDEGKGIGKRLHHTMLDWYFNQTNETLWLGTAPRTRAEKFYRLQGWKECGTNGPKELRFEMSFDDWTKSRR